MGGVRWPSVGTLHATGDFFSLTGAVRAHGDTPLRPGTLRACGDRIPVPDGVECPRPCGNVSGGAGCPRPGRLAPARARCPRRRRMFLWTGPPRIEDVLFGRGLRSPTEGDGSDAVVWGRSTSWAQNAVLDVPGRPCGAVVGTSQGLPRPRRSALPMRGCAVRRTGAAARRRRRYRSGPAGATSWWSSPRVRVLVAHDGLACQFRAAPA